MAHMAPVDYLNILPTKEALFYKKLIFDIESNSVYFQRNAESVRNKLMRQIKISPYPILQILKETVLRKSSLVENSIYCALEDFITNDSLKHGELPLEFVNFVANFDLFEMEMIQVRLRLLPEIVGLNSDRLFIALIARNDPTLLDDVLRLRTQSPSIAVEFSNKETILQDAVVNNKHFIVSAINQQKNFSNITDVVTRNLLIILKICNEFSTASEMIDSIENIGEMIELLDVTATDLPADVEKVHKLFYADFQRIRVIADFLQRFRESSVRISINTIIESTGILQLLYDHKNILLIGYDETKKIIETNHHWELLMPAVKQVRDQELESLTYFFVLATIYDIIVAKMCTETFATAKLLQLHSMLRQVRNIDILCSLIEDIFQLIFLRWEHLYNQRRFSTDTSHHRSKSTKSEAITSSSSAAESVPAPVLTDLPRPTKQGFICRGRALRAIFTFLKNFVTKKLHSEEYKNSPERIQIRFTRIFDIISEALWKYAILEKIIDWNSDRSETCRLLEAEDLVQLVQLHTDANEKTSSEDESKERSNYVSLTRRKVATRKRRRATFSGGTVSIHMEKLKEKDSISTSGNDNNIAKPEHNISIQLSQSADRSIIPKMLGSPENLAIMALAMKNFNDVKYIIQTFHLHNTELDRELAFMEQQQQTKKKLATIYDLYERQEEQLPSSTTTTSTTTPTTTIGFTAKSPATVEKIRKVIAKGFEASKIISIIDSFAQSRTIGQTEKTRELLEKYSSNNQYPFLHQYMGLKLQVIFVTDLILTLPFNYEITSNILTVIRRMVNDTELPNVNGETIKSNFSKEIGCIPLLENLCECIRLQQSSLRNILIDNFYSLKPRKLIAELEREKNFVALFQMKMSNIGRCEDLKSHANRFADFKSKINYYERFIVYIGNIRKLVQMRDRNLEFHTTELLKFDLRDIIGELIFEDNMTPLEIEVNVVSLNLNMVHMIALNICPEIAVGNENATDKIRQRRLSASDKVKYRTIFNYISNQNELLGFLLQRINSTQAEATTMNDDYLQRYLQLSEIVHLSEIYDGNGVIAILRSDKIDLERIKRLPSRLVQLKILLAFCINTSSSDMNKDNLISELISGDLKLVYLINLIESNISLRAALIQKYFTKVESSRIAKDLIECTLYHREAETKIELHLRNQLEHTLDDISVYSQVSEVLQFESWPQAYDFGMKTPNMILEKLLYAGHYELCYNWCKVVRLSERFVQQTRTFFNTFLEIFLSIKIDTELNPHLLRIVETFPTPICVQFYDANKDRFRSISLLNYVIDFLVKNSNLSSATMAYKNFTVSLKIFEQLNQRELDQFWNLLRHPLLIIEQLIMNAKFEVLSKVFTAVRQILIGTSTLIIDDKTASSQCEFCFDKRGNVYDIHPNRGCTPTQFSLGSTDNSSSAFILLNFNLYQANHIISIECVDLLLRIYATKALDYQISEAYSSSSSSTGRVSQSTDMASLDSLCVAFHMPNVPPNRDDWTKDEEALHCMCCRRAAFTMFMRRHHCRRCGRVVCFACSINRMRIPELYAEVEVRICNDCHRQTAAATAIAENRKGKSSDDNRTNNSNHSGQLRWQLSGNITHDKLLREEFCYEHAPSVALGLSILSFHHENKKCVDLLLYHCCKLEKLLVPNPEVDFELIAKMMNCLALAAKVRAGPPEVETIREHSDIIMSVVQNGCESLIPAGPINNHSLRKLGDSLVEAEKWQLALEVHLKCGFSTAGVMAAHGLSCLRAGCFEIAREKFSHCMQKVSTEFSNANIFKNISEYPTNSDSKRYEILKIRRPKRSPPLLLEIIKILESIPYTKPQTETLARASIIRNSNSSLASILSRRKDISLHEPALNVLTTLANLKLISKGQYYNESNANPSPLVDNIKHVQRQSRIYEECLYYVLTYGSHADVIRFFIRNQELGSALRYFILQNLDAEHFIRNIFLSFLRCGEVPLLIDQMNEIDNNLVIWNDILIQTCRYLEKKNLLNSLYQLQILLKDPIRASMTCVKFYTMNCETFQQLQNNAIHLHNAQKHLQTELELSQWENINLNERSRSRRQSTTTNVSHLNFIMQMDPRSLNGHINTILRQLDVTKFLAKCEKEYSDRVIQQPATEDDNEKLNMAMPQSITEIILKQIRIEAAANSLPTLFDSTQEKIQICILLLLSGKNIEEGFGLAYRIIQDYMLPQTKVFGATAKYLARHNRLGDVEQLINCITSNNNGGGGGGAVDGKTNNRDLDELLSIAINSACNNHEPNVRAALDNLVKKISNIELRISCHIFIGQLKSAYLLANKYERIADIRRILRQAEASNQIHIKKLCEKKLNLNQLQ